MLVTVAGMISGSAASWLRPEFEKRCCAFQHAPHPQTCVRFYGMRDARLHTRANLYAGRGVRTIRSAGWRAAYVSDLQRLDFRPGFEVHPLEIGARPEGRLRCAAHTHTPSQGGRGAAQG